MQIRFSGVRGSMPAPGPDTIRYGGNTSCVGVEFDTRVLILDAGTGIRALGDTLAGGEKDLYVLFTHLHDDHIQGLPFFAPLYEEGRTVHLLQYHPPDGGAPWSPLELFDGRHFPLRPDDLPAHCHTVEHAPLAFLRRQGIDISRLVANHPGGAYGYRIQHEGQAFVYLPDNELVPPGEGRCSIEEVTAFCEGADVLCHDAQYRREDLSAKWGWGHSMVSQACALARRAGVGALVLFHHDPRRTDEALDALQARARELLRDSAISCGAAWEGLRLDAEAIAAHAVAEPPPRPSS
ncbi:MAG: MBL fold metallo-hydrolase [Salinibacter sp.]